MKFHVGKYYIHKLFMNRGVQYYEILVCLELVNNGALLYECCTFKTTKNIVKSDILECKFLLEQIFSNNLNLDYLIFRNNKTSFMYKLSPVQFDFNIKSWYLKYKLLNGKDDINEIIKRQY